METKFIIHIDGDAFFAACEVSRRPDLKGKPVVVGEDRGIACALTYEAKKLGIHRGMPIFQIRKEFPKVKVLTSHFELYRKFYRSLLLILHEKLSVIEPYSIDECFAEVPLSVGEEEIEQFVRDLKRNVQKNLGITFSFGVAQTKTLAKLASKAGKPDGCFFLVNQKDIDESLKLAPVGSIWGIGRSLSASLIGRNVITAFDFKNLSPDFLEKYYSKPVISTWLELNGKQAYEVSVEHEDKKSIQSTRSLTQKTSDYKILFSELSKNTEEACQSLRESNLFTNHIYFYFKGDKSSYRARIGSDAILPVFTQDPGLILETLEPIMQRLWKKGVMYKSTGITLSNLRSLDHIPDDLFCTQTKALEADSYNKLLDSINDRFGDWSIMRASSMQAVKSRTVERLQRDSRDNYEYGLPYIYMGEVI